MQFRDDDHEDYFVCPNCGTELRINASFCRECGASEDSGWGDEWEDSGEWFDDPDEEDDFDYDEFVRGEFPEHTETRARLNWIQWTVMILLVLLCLAIVFQVFS